MPVREINNIRHGDRMYINHLMYSTYDLKEGDILLGEIRRHFDSKKQLKNEINKPFELTVKNRWIEIGKDLPSLAKYKIQEDEYVEVVFTGLKRGRTTQEIFPSEEKKYLDFDPDVKEEE